MHNCSKQWRGYICKGNLQGSRSNQKLNKSIKKKLEPIKIKGIKARINKLQNKKQEYEDHIKNRTIPKIVFGGRHTFMNLQKGKISKTTWKDLRSNQLYSIGGRDDGGNQNVPNVYVKICRNVEASRSGSGPRRRRSCHRGNRGKM